MNSSTLTIERIAANGAARLSGFPCRACGAAVERTFVDLGLSPLCENYIAAERVDQPEVFYPLHAYVCQSCWLVQLREYVPPEEIFTEYAYFSSYSDSWVEHARRYRAAAIERFHLGADSQVVEVASNDGYLLQHFVARGIPCLGVEPAANVAREAEKKGVPTRVVFFGEATAERLREEGVRADLLIGNNVLAHTPHLNDFLAGIKCLLAPRGVVALEFPHLERLIDENQFDTIYHEHFSYFSLLSAEQALARQGLAIFDVEELTTHGGSLRLFAKHVEDEHRSIEPSVGELIARERRRGFDGLEAYERFAEQVRMTKRDLLAFLIDARRAGKRVAAYGAPGKGNTLLNYCGIREDFLDYAVDRNPYKHGKFTPGARLPIYAPSKLAETRPDYILILPWNLKDEIAAQLAYTREWGARLVVPIPELSVFNPILV